MTNTLEKYNKRNSSLLYGGNELVVTQNHYHTFLKAFDNVKTAFYIDRIVQVLQSIHNEEQYHCAIQHINNLINEKDADTIRNPYTRCHRLIINNVNTNLHKSIEEHDKWKYEELNLFTRWWYWIPNNAKKWNEEVEYSKINAQNEYNSMKAKINKCHFILSDLDKIMLNIIDNMKSYNDYTTNIAIIKNNIIQLKRL